MLHRREEKTITSKAVPLLKERFLASRRGVGVGGPPPHTLTFTSLPNADGTVRVIFSRGKPKITYEFEKLTVEWAIVSGEGGPASSSSSSSAAAAVATGTATLVEVSDSDSDVFEGLQVNTITAEAPLTLDAAGGMVRKSETFFREIVKAWVEVLKSS